MPSEIEYLLSSLYIPELGSVVHRASRNEQSVGIKGETDDLHLVALQSVVALASLRVPDLGCAVKGPSHYLISIRIIEGHCIDHIFVFLEGEEFLSADRIPDFARSVVAPRDELVT